MSHPYRGKRERKAARSQTELLGEMADNLTSISERLIISTVVAAYRDDQITLEAGAAFLQVTPEAFTKAGEIVNDEARRLMS